MTVVETTGRGRKIFSFILIDNNRHILYTKRESFKLVQNFMALSFLSKYKTTARAVSRNEDLKANTKLLETGKKNIIDNTLIYILKAYFSKLDERSFLSCQSYLSLQHYDLSFVDELLRNNLCLSCNSRFNLISLDCNHKLCYKCLCKLVRGVFSSVSNLVNIDPGSLLFPCTACGSHISERILRMCEGYTENIEHMHQRLMYKCACGVVGGQEMFIGGCREMCNACTLYFLRYNYDSCNRCNRPYTQEELDQLLALTQRCDGCSRDVNQLKFFRGRFCGHNFCSSCLKMCFVSHKCLRGCGRANYDYEDSKSYTQSLCVRCGTDYDDCNDFDSAKNCSCLICTRCQVGGSKSVCIVCTLDLPPRAVYSLGIYEETHKKVFKPCPICTNLYDSDLIVQMTDCDHVSCLNCLKEYMKANLDANTFGQCLSCPQCTARINSNQLEKIIKSIGGEYWDKLNFFLIQCEFKLIQCPMCMNQFIPDVNRLARCANRNCNFVFCKECLEPFHQEGSCQDLIIHKSLKMMEEIYPSNEISQCPGCRYPYLKDKCGHVTCIGANCKTVFCFYCSCLRSPYFCHGMHYHRPSCKLYVPYDGADVIRQDCDECKRLGAVCPRPQNLRVPCRVDPDEVSNN